MHQNEWFAVRAMMARQERLLAEAEAVRNARRARTLSSGDSRGFRASVAAAFVALANRIDGEAARAESARRLAEL